VASQRYLWAVQVDTPASAQVPPKGNGNR